MENCDTLGTVSRWQVDYILFWLNVYQQSEAEVKYAIV